MALLLVVVVVVPVGLAVIIVNCLLVTGEVVARVLAFLILDLWLGAPSRSESVVAEPAGGGTPISGVRGE